MPTSWISQDERHLHRVSGIKPILEQTVTTHGAHVALANRAVPIAFAVQCFVRLTLEGPTTGATIWQDEN